MPLIGKHVILLYNEADPSRIEVQLEGRCHGLLTPLDLNVNCRVRRRDRNRLILESAQNATLPSGRLVFTDREDA